MTTIVDSIIQLFHEKGGSLYGGEEVTQLQHALQTAQLARKSGASSFLITAALLHDIGHLLHDLSEDAPDKGLDDYHENLAVNYLRNYFSDSVIEPIRLHVEAKRYLCATDKNYKITLSAASLQSLALQGGPLNAAEMESFEKSNYFKDAVELRKWDDLAKDIHMQTPPIEEFEVDIINALTAKNNR
jgi:phosphonate degradation associated HDIG domain protein